VWSRFVASTKIIYIYKSLLCHFLAFTGVVSLFCLPKIFAVPLRRLPQNPHCILHHSLPDHFWGPTILSSSPFLFLTVIHPSFRLAGHFLSLHSFGSFLLEETSFLDHSAGVAAANIEAGLEPRGAEITRDATFPSHLVSQHGQGTASTSKREAGKTVEAAVFAKVVGGLLQGKARAEGSEAANADIFVAFAASLVPFVGHGESQLGLVGKRRFFWGLDAFGSGPIGFVNYRSAEGMK
jgi:hypothetical protein